MGRIISSDTYLSTTLPKRLVRSIRRKYNIQTFVETGTFEGKCSEWAAKIFKNVYTVELSKDIYKSTQERLKDIKNIHCHFGNSSEFIKDVTLNMDEMMFFWLDAHYSFGRTAGKDILHPLLTECSCISSHKQKHIIFIDDVRFLFFPRDVDFIHRWPRIDEIIGIFNSSLHEYSCYVFSDMLCVVPSECKNLIYKFKHDYQHYYDIGS